MLSDFLREENERQEDQRRLKEEEAKQKADAGRKFREDSKILFESTIRPAIVEIQQVLRDNGVYVESNPGIRLYENNAGISSLSFAYNKSVIHLDIVALPLKRSISLVFNFLPNPERSVTYDLQLHEVNKDVIEKHIVDELRKV